LSRGERGGRQERLRRTWPYDACTYNRPKPTLVMISHLNSNFNHRSNEVTLIQATRCGSRLSPRDMLVRDMTGIFLGHGGKKDLRYCQYQDCKAPLPGSCKCSWPGQAFVTSLHCLPSDFVFTRPYYSSYRHIGTCDDLRPMWTSQMCQRLRMYGAGSATQRRLEIASFRYLKTTFGFHTEYAMLQRKPWRLAIFPPMASFIGMKTTWVASTY
jgi:hypothetical protein